MQSGTVGLNALHVPPSNIFIQLTLKHSHMSIPWREQADYKQNVLEQNVFWHFANIAVESRSPTKN